MKTDEPPLTIMCIPIIICTIMLLLSPTLQDDKPQQLSLNTTGSALIAQSSPENIRQYTMASLVDRDIIRRLAVCESGLNNSAINWNDIHRWPDGTISRGSFGLLQYGKPTFQYFCVNKYGLENNIWDPEIQIECASRMIAEGYLYHWGCAKLIDKIVH